MKTDIRTDRLILRQWRDDDRSVFAQMNRDADVMRFFPRVFSRAESDEFVTANANHIADHGWGNWALETRDGGDFIGFTGFSQPPPWHPCAGEIEIGWRLRKQFWRQGYATEAAIGALATGFGDGLFDTVVSFTTRGNLASIGVMEKISMTRAAVGFEHPRIEVGCNLRSHVVYRLNRCDWKMVRGC